MKFISLFAGIGGFDLALENLGHECVYANDFNKYAAQIYDKQFSLQGDRSSRFDSGRSESSVQSRGSMSPVKESPTINNDKNFTSREHLQEQGTSRDDLRPTGVESDIDTSKEGWQSGDANSCNKNLSKREFTSSCCSDGGDEPGINNSNGNGRGTNTSGVALDQRDITTVPTEEIPDHDLLCGGFPCQSFSIAGHRRGFDDTRGTMFFEVARVLRDKKPRYFILENVKGLLSHDSGRTFKVIISTLVELGYDLQWQVLNSKNFGVPQNRERVYIVGHLRGERRPEIFPSGTYSQETSQLQGHKNDISNTLTTRYAPAQATGTYIGESQRNAQKGSGRLHQLVGGSQGFRIYNPDGISTTLASNAGGLGAKTGLYAVKMERSDEAKRIRRESMKNGKDWSPRQGKKLGLRDDDLMNTITANWEVNQAVTDGIKIRRLTPLECERLQGFPDGWTEFGLVNGEVIKMSDTQRYKTLGNAVSVPVVNAVARCL